MNKPISKETATDLFVMQVRGLLASAISRRGVEPTCDQLAALRSDNLTERRIAELAETFGASLRLTIVERMGQDFDAQDE